MSIEISLPDVRLPTSHEAETSYITDLYARTHQLPGRAFNDGRA